MKTLKHWTRADDTSASVNLTVEKRHLLRLSVLDDDLIRVSLLKDGAWRLSRTWSVAPGGEMPWEGRSRDDLAGFPCPGFRVPGTDPLVLETARLRLTVGRPLCLTSAALTEEGDWRAFAEERPTGAYMAGARDHGHGHFLLRHPGERIHGLGEKAGELERTGRRFEMRNLDAMGYDARTTDPLYKHIPFATPSATSRCFPRLAVSPRRRSNTRMTATWSTRRRRRTI